MHMMFVKSVLLGMYIARVVGDEFGFHFTLKSESRMDCGQVSGSRESRVGR